MAIRRRFISVVVSAMSVSAASMVLAFARQLLIAAYFGVSRQLEIYMFAYAVANWVGFAIGGVLDQVVVPHLVRQRESDGAGSAHALARAIFRSSLAFGIAAGLLMIAATYLLAPIIATGFSVDDRARLSGLAWYFLPWICLYVVYYAAAAQHKSEWRFNRVFLAELLVAACSILWLVLQHGSVRQLPAAYCAGYAAGLLWLLPGSGLLARSGRSPSLRHLLRDAGELYLANQTANVPGIADRHFQSLVPAGGIAAIGYSTQLLMGFSSLIGMRDIFVVPLAEAERRDDKMERLMSGLLLLSVPVAGAVACFAPELIRVLFQRGHFDAAATKLTAAILRIMAFTLITSAMTMPLARMLLILRRIRLMHFYYLASAMFLLLFGSAFVLWLGLGARGIAWMNVATSLPSLAVLAWLAARCGVVVPWRRMARLLLLASATTAAAAGLGLAAAAPFADAWLRLLAGGPAYAAAVAGAYLVLRRKLLRAAA